MMEGRIKLKLENLARGELTELVKWLEYRLYATHIFLLPPSGNMPMHVQLPADPVPLLGGKWVPGLIPTSIALCETV